jgi:hypothetical protein
MSQASSRTNAAHSPRDVERDESGFARIRIDPRVDRRIGQSDHVLQARRIFQARQRRLRAQVDARVRQPPAGELERRIGAQTIQIVGVLIAAADRENAGPDHVSEAVRYPRGIAAVRKDPSEPIGDPKPPLGHGQQHDAAIRREASAVESGCDLLA